MISAQDAEGVFVGLPVASPSYRANPYGLSAISSRAIRPIPFASYELIPKELEK